MPLSLLISLLSIVLLILTGCASSAPDLPKDYNSVDSKDEITESLFNKEDLAKSCYELSEEVNLVNHYRNAIDVEVEKDRVDEQAVAFAAAVTLPVSLLFLQEKSGVTEQLKSLQERKDTIRILERYKNCQTKGDRSIS